MKRTPPRSTNLNRPILKRSWPVVEYMFAVYCRLNIFERVQQSSTLSSNYFIPSSPAYPWLAHPSSSHRQELYQSVVQLQHPRQTRWSVSCVQPFLHRPSQMGPALLHQVHCAVFSNRPGEVTNLQFR